MSRSLLRPKLMMTISSLGNGGAEKVFLDLVQGLDKEWIIEVVLFEGGHHREKILHDLSIPFHIITKNRFFPNFLASYRKLCIQTQPDIILSFLNYPNIITWLATIGTNIPLVTSERSNYRRDLAQYRSSFMKMQLLSLVYRSRRVKKISAVSDAVTQMIAEDFKIAPARLVAIPNGIDASSLRNLSAETLPEDLQNAVRFPSIAAVGRLVPAKDYGTLLNAIAIVKKTFGNISLVIAGDGPLRADLEVLCNTLNLAGNVVFAGHLKNPHALVAKASLFVMSSQYEGYPNALAEAMLVNGCCISTDCPTGPREIITHGFSGLLTEPGDPKALADAIVNLLSAPSMQASFKDAAAGWAEKNTTVQMIRRYHQMLSEILRR